MKLHIGLVILGACLATVGFLARRAIDSENQVVVVGRTANVATSPWTPQVLVSSRPVLPQHASYLLDRAVHWSYVKSGPSIDEHLIRLLPWKNFASSTMDNSLVRLTDTSRQREYGGNFYVLVESPFGATYRTDSSVFDAVRLPSLGHVDAAPAAFGEARLSLDLPIKLHAKSLQLRHVLLDSLCRSSLDRELEWSVVFYSTYLPADGNWRNSRGERLTISALTDRLLTKGRGDGPCSGVHLPWAVGVARMKLADSPLAADRKTASDCAAWLRRTAQVCQSSQLPNGSWNRKWHDPAAALTETYSTLIDQRLDEVRTTGHLLEAFSILPDSERPSEDSIENALEFIDTTLMSDPDLYLSKDFSGTTHAIRALLVHTDFQK